MSGFVHAIGFAVDGQNFRMMNQPVDDRDHARYVREDLSPLSKRTIGGDDIGFVFVTPFNHLKQKVCVLVVV